MERRARCLDGSPDSNVDWDDSESRVRGGHTRISVCRSLSRPDAPSVSPSSPPPVGHSWAASLALAVCYALYDLDYSEVSRLLAVHSLARISLLCMESFPYGSLAQIRMLLLPVGNIRRSTFETWVQEIKGIDTIRLGDLTTDVKDERCTSRLGWPRLYHPFSLRPQHASCPITSLRADTCI